MKASNLVIFDLDGTLSHDSKFDLGCKDGIKKLKETGYFDVAILSSNSIVNIDRQFENMQDINIRSMFSYIWGENGASELCDINTSYDLELFHTFMKEKIEILSKLFLSPSAVLQYERKQ